MGGGAEVRGGNSAKLSENSSNKVFNTGGTLDSLFDKSAR
jgi:hypothetical protein